MKKILFLLTFIGMFVSYATAQKVTTNYRNALVFAYSQANGVYEDDNIKLMIYDEQLWAENKTNKTIFIDLSQCFLVHNGSSFPMFDQKQNEKYASKKGVTTSIDEFITIAPKAGVKVNETYIVTLTAAGYYGQVSTVESPTGDFSDYDKRLLSAIDELVTESQKADPKGKEYLGTVSKHFDEEESVRQYGANLAYAFNKKAEDWTNVSISTWVSDIIFAPYYIEIPEELSKKEKRGFGVKETNPAFVHVLADQPFEFDAEKSPIIVTDWEGDFKKGTFTLGMTRISKTKKPNVFARIAAGIITSGLSELFVSYNTTYYKSMIRFDSPDESEWGKMNYVEDKEKTGQK